MSIQGVDRKYRIIRGVSLITRGESLGHDSWNDLHFLAEVTQAAQALEPKGVKSRFRHPGICFDGLGSYLGQIHNVRMVGDQVVGDLHISPAADESPDGQLGSYAMTMAEQAPEAFGLSIVFDPGEKVQPEPGSEFYDERNVRGLPHERLSRLIACDLVDAPAANPFGLFANVTDLRERAAPVLMYALGLSHDPPVKQLGAGIHPRAIRDWMTDFLKENHLQVLRINAQEANKMAEITDPMENPDYKAGYEAGLKAAQVSIESNKPDEDDPQDETQVESQDETRDETQAESQDEQQFAEKPASVEELSDIPGATPEFIVEQLKARATLFAAQRALLKTLSERGERSEQPARRSAAAPPVQTPAAATAPVDLLTACREQARRELPNASAGRIEAYALNLLIRRNPEACRDYYKQNPQ